MVPRFGDFVANLYLLYDMVVHFLVQRFYSQSFWLLLHQLQTSKDVLDILYLVHQLLVKY